MALPTCEAYDFTQDVPEIDSTFLMELLAEDPNGEQYCKEAEDRINGFMLSLESEIVGTDFSDHCSQGFGESRLDDILSYLDTDDSSRPLSTCYMMDVEEMYTDDQIYMDEAGMMMIMIDDQKDYEEYFYYAESLGEQMCMPLWQ